MTGKYANYYVIVSGVSPDEEEQLRDNLKAALEVFANDLKNKHASGNIGVEVNSSHRLRLHFKPGDNLVWD